MPYPEEPWSLDKTLSSPMAAALLPLGAGFLAGLTPGTARMAHTGLATLGLVQQAQQRQEEERRRRKLAEAIPQLLGATNTVRTPAASLPATTTSLGLAAEEGGQFGAGSVPQATEIAPETTRETPVFTPHARSLLSTVGEHAPEQALGIIARQLFKEEEPYTLGPGHARFRGGEKLAEVAPLTPQARPLNPLEERNIQSQIDERKARAAQVGQPRPLNPLEEQNIRSQMSERNARIGRLNSLTVSGAGGPQMTMGQLSASLNALIRNRSQPGLTSEEVEAIDRDIVEVRLAMAQVRNAGGGGAAGSEMAQLPPAAKHNGKIVRDTQTGQRFQSNGTDWIPLQGGGEY